jgi:hypothetical protein
MTWKRQLFGAENPTRARVVGMSLLWVFIGLMTMGLFVDFIPADGLHGVPAVLVFGFVGLVLTVATLLMGITKGRASDVIRRGGGTTRTALSVAILPPMFGLMLWLATVKGAGWLVTRSIGTPEAKHVMLLTHHTSSRRSCDYQLKGPPLDASFPGYVCIPEALYRSHPNQTIAVELRGRSTAAGFAIISVYTDP